MFKKVIVRFLLAAALAAAAVSARADVFHMPSGQTSLQLVPVGDPGNAADPATGHGAVPYTYQMGKSDVTVSQYCQFLNAVAKTSDPYGLYARTTGSVSVLQVSLNPVALRCCWPAPWRMESGDDAGRHSPWSFIPLS